MIARLILALLLVATPVTAQTLPSALNDRIAAAAQVPVGKVGVAAIDLDTGATLSVNGDERFPMASAVKVAIAAAWLDGVDRGLWSLATLYPLDESMRVRSDGITDTLPHPGVMLSGANRSNCR